MMENYFKEYLENYKKLIETISAEEVASFFAIIKKAIEEERQIFVFGNGGSAMSMSHFATDIVKGVTAAIGKNAKVISLNDNAGLLTAIGNDYAFEDIFYRQLMVMASPEDVVLTLSVSGNSSNLLKAFEWANDNGLHTAAMIGGAKGKLASIAKSVIVIDALHYGFVEDAHMLINHMIAFGFIDNA